MKKRINEILKKYGVDRYHWKLEIAAELSAAFEDKLRDELIEYEKWHGHIYSYYYYSEKATMKVDEYLKGRDK